MSRVYLKAGIHFKLDGQAYKILKVFSNRDVEAEDMKFHQIMIFKETEIIKLLYSGNLMFESNGKNYTPDSHGNKYHSDFNDISSDVKEEHIITAKYRLAVIKPILSVPNRKLNDVINRVNEINKGFIDPTYAKNNIGFEIIKKVSIQSVYRWLKDFEESNYEFCALIPSYHRSGGKNKRRIDEVIENIIKETVETYYNTKQRLSITDVYYAVVNNVEELNSISDKKHRIPSESTIFRYIQTLPESLSIKTCLKHCITVE